MHIIIAPWLLVDNLKRDIFYLRCAYVESDHLYSFIYFCFHHNEYHMMIVCWDLYASVCYFGNEKIEAMRIDKASKLIAFDYSNVD